MKKIIEPSLLAFDKQLLPQQLQIVKGAGCDFIHYDVMDGVFVANKAYDTEWLPMIHQLGLKANVHFMVKTPFTYIRRFLKFPVNSITFHPEAISKSGARLLIYYMKMRRVPCGIAIKPSTNISKYISLLKICDYVLIMGVEPGAGGQKFMPECLENLKKARAIKDIFNKRLIVQLDGGVNPDVISLTESYVDQYIMGNYLMKQSNIQEFLSQYQK